MLLWRIFGECVEAQGLPWRARAGIFNLGFGRVVFLACRDASRARRTGVGLCMCKLLTRARTHAYPRASACRAEHAPGERPAVAMVAWEAHAKAHAYGRNVRPRVRTGVVYVGGAGKLGV